MKAAHYLTSGLRGIVAAAFVSCYSTLATRPYTAENRQENAYLNMRDILADRCCNSLFDSYPRCENFKIDQQGFLCGQMTVEGTMNTMYFTWEEIEQVRCKEHTGYTGLQLHIDGKYDSSFIWTRSSQQCPNLEKAMRIYLQERKK